MTSTESVIAQHPFTVRRRVKWGECDPAGVVYTVAFSEYVISVAELFYGMLFGTSPQKAKDELGFGTPTRALSFDFQRSLRPDDEFDMTVRVADIRERTYLLEIHGRTLTGDTVFVAELTPVCVARPERRSILIPPGLRAALAQYRTACADVLASGEPK
jgi:acyl-CoA thioester hydrolase